MGWMYSHNRKKHQRRINRYVRMINENLSNDPLWKGRFVVSQVGPTYFRQYEDGSGAEFYATLQIFDKETGDYTQKTKNGNEWCWRDGIDLWWFVNDAIIKWREEYDF